MSELTPVTTVYHEVDSGSFRDAECVVEIDTSATVVPVGDSLRVVDAESGNQLPSEWKYYSSQSDAIEHEVRVTLDYFVDQIGIMRAMLRLAEKYRSEGASQ